MSYSELVGSLQEFIEIPDSTVFKTRVLSQTTSAQPGSRPHTKRRVFDIKEHLRNTGNQALVDVIRTRKRGQEKGGGERQHRSLAAQSIVGRLNKTEHSFFMKKDSQDAQVDILDKHKLNKKHQLLKSIIRTQEEQNKFKGSSIYDESFKRLYEGLHQVHVNPIPDKEPIHIDEADMVEGGVHIFKRDFEGHHSGIAPKLRLRLENCKNWAKRHHKSTSWYCRELGDSQDDSREQDSKPHRRDNLLGSIKQLLK